MSFKGAEIHQTAIIEDGAQIMDGAKVGPYCCIGSSVVVCNDVHLESHVVVSGNTTIGKNSSVFPFASLGTEPQDLKYHKEKSRLEIGEGTVIREGVTISIGTEVGGMMTKVGDNCLIMAYCHVAHDCFIGNNVILTNGANLSGHVHIDDYAIIGGMCAVKQFVRIGKHAMIGGFTGVDRDVIPYGLVRGKRTATIKGLNIVGLKRRKFPVSDISVAVDAYKEIFETNTNLTISERVSIISEKFAENELVRDIVEFLMVDSKNSICTAISQDEG